jgi:hypothetical protein
MPTELGIRKGDVWAFRESTRLPLVRARVVNQPAHYEAPITIRLLDDPGRGLISVRRVKLPCKWENVAEYLERHPEIAREMPPPSDMPPADSIYDPLDVPADDLFSMGERALRRIIRDEIKQIVGVPRISLDYRDASRAVGYSQAAIRIAVDQGELSPSYQNSKPVFLVSELERWVSSLPHERP